MRLLPRLYGLIVALLVVCSSMLPATAQICPRDGNTDQVDGLTLRDVVLTFQHYLGIAEPPLDACAQQRANVFAPERSSITPADARCIFQRFLGLPSCLNNTPPLLEALTDQQVTLGTTLRFQVTATDAENDPVHLSVQPLPLPPNVRFNPDSGEFSFTPAAHQIGTFPLTFTVSDGEFVTSTSLTLTVVAGNGTTALAGVVLTTNDAPLPGVRLEVAGRSTMSEADGSFQLHDLPAGAQRLLIDGSTVEAALGTFATVPEVVTLLAGTTNRLRAPIFLLPLDVASADLIDPTQDSVVDSSPVMVNGEQFPAVVMTVPAGTARSEDSGDMFRGMVHISQIPAPHLGPMPLPADIDLSVYIAVQPFGVRYDPPVAIAFPNVDRFPVGAIVDIFGLNHDTGVFEKVGDGQVRADGMVHSGTYDPVANVFTPGGVVRSNSWHGFVPQPPLGGPPPDPGPPCPDDCNDQPVGSSAVDRRTGDLQVEHVLPTYISLGRRQRLQLEYHSATAFPAPLIAGLVTTGNLTPPPLFMASEAEVAGVMQGRVVTQGPPFCPLNCPFIRHTQAMDATTFATGVYPATLRIDCLFPVSRRSRTFPREIVVLNNRQSPFGAGWGIRGLQQVHRTATGTLLLTQGDDTALVFSPALRARAELLASGVRHTYRFTANRGDTVSIRLRRRSNLPDGSGALDPVIEVFNSQNILLVRDDDSGTSVPPGPGRNAQIPNYVLPATDTYTIAVTGKGGSRGPYDLFLTASTATELLPVGNIAASLETTVLNPPGDTLGLVLQPDGSFQRPMRDGSVVLFNSEGLQTARRDRQGNTTRYRYNAQGHLRSIEDAVGLVTALRYTNGLLREIEDPAGRISRFTHDADGNLIAITNPDGSIRRFAYDERHLLRLQISPGGLETRYEYDFSGRFTRTVLPDGSERRLASSQSLGLVDPASGLGTATNPAPFLMENNVESGFTDSAGRRRTFMTDVTGALTRVVDTNGLTTRIERDAIGNPQRLTLPGGGAFAYGYDDNGNLRALRDDTTDGTVRFAYDQAGRLHTVTNAHGDTTTIAYDADGNVVQITTPQGRSLQFAYNARGLLTRTSNFLGTTTIYTYDAMGNPATVTQGEAPEQRGTAFTYTPEGSLASITDPLGRVATFTYDAMGRVTSQTLPGERVMRYTYDANGRLASVTPPEREAARFTYTPAGRVEVYSLPDGSGGSSETRYTYNTTRQLTRVVRPGDISLDLRYDSAGRLQVVTSAQGDILHAYDPGTGKLRTVTAPDGGTLTYTYTGDLLTTTTWDGAVAGSVRRTYDVDERVATEQINDGNAITYHYNADGLLHQVGDLTLTLLPQSGLLSELTLGNIAETRQYNAFAEFTGQQVSVASTDIYRVTLRYDALGRITRKVETIEGTTTTYNYTYDLASRLATVRRNGTIEASYTYDAQGNRLRLTTPDTTVNGTYDPQDRLRQYGDMTYTYTANGELASRTRNGQTTSYDYDVMGNLLGVTQADGTIIRYVIDGQNRRIGKRLNGTLTRGWLYADRLRPLAELDGTGNIVSRFVYGSRRNVPDYLLRDGNTYRIIADHLGSPRLVLDVETGAVAQRLDYDAFGNVLRDTNPGFQPFGFAGGLYDPQTGLVRFGVRDYDPTIGRWTARDPVLFAGANTETNAYTYARLDPINLLDSNGRDPLPPEAYIPAPPGTKEKIVDPETGEITYVGVDENGIEFEIQCTAGGSTCSASFRDPESGYMETREWSYECQGNCSESEGFDFGTGAGDWGPGDDGDGSGGGGGGNGGGGGGDGDGGGGDGDGGGGSGGGGASCNDEEPEKCYIEYEPNKFIRVACDLYDPKLGPIRPIRRF